MTKKILWLASLLGLLILLALAVERSRLPETTPAMREKAEDFGEKRGKETPPLPFHFDGCTLFPDNLPGLDHQPACLDHDITYWYGGSQEERRQADQVFRREVAESGPLGPVLQYPMYIAVRIGGDSWLAEYFKAHWGFGHRN